MEATLRSVWNWAVTQFNYAIGGIKQLWYKLLDFLTFLKDSIGSLMSSLKAKFCYSSETATVTRSTSVPSTPEGEFTERVKVHQRKTEFEVEVGNPPAKRRRTQQPQEDLEKEIKLIEDTSNHLAKLADVMKQDLRASTTAEAEKTTAKVQDLLESSDTERLITGLRTANLSLV